MKRTIVIALIVVCMVFGVVAYATAADPSQTVTVTVKPTAFLTLTVNNSTVDFGAMTPDQVMSISKAVTLKVSSNKAWTLKKDLGLAAVNMNLTTSIPATATHSERGKDMPYDDNYTINGLPWDVNTDAFGVQTGSVIYTVSQ